MNILKFTLAPALCALVLSGCGGGGGGGGTRPTPTTVPTTTPTTAPLPVNNAIVFQSAGQIARINPDGSGFQVLDSRRAQSPSFTRDKSAFVYLVLLSDTTAQAIIGNTDATGTRIVPNVPADILDPDINPTGSQLAFTTLMGNDESLSVINTDGTGLRSISRAPVLRSPVWSPDGSYLVFSQFDGDTAANTGIFRINADGTGKRRLNALEDAFDFDFNPAGTTIAFTDSSGVDSRVRLMNADGSNVRDLNINLPNSRSQSPSFSPDGNRIVFAAGSASDSFLSLYTVAATGGAATMITGTAGVNAEDDAPDWR